MEANSSSPIINQCPECSKDIDVSDLAPFSKISCPHCDASIRVRTRLGQYEIRSLLGEGGMSQVFAADDLTLGRKVALKILHQSLSQDSNLIQMFEREAKLTASINHPNVVKVFTVGHEREYLYIAMELVDAISIDQKIAQEGALPEATVLKLAYDVVSGLRAAYQNNLIHRDIKPGNMLMTANGTVKLVDFGLAVAQGGEDDSEDLWATPFYVPPEKLIREPDTHLGDIYALGATCYHALAGKPPFDANTSSIEELIQIKAAGLNLKSEAPGASRPVIRLIEQMMAYRASDRPQNYDLLLDQIVECENMIGGATTGASFHAPPPIASEKRPGWLVWTGAGVAALTLGGLAMYFMGTETDHSLDSLLLDDKKERVISVEEREAAQKMLAGRQAMVTGNYQEARRIFLDLQNNPYFSQPSKGWNTFNEGLVHLMLGDEAAARKTFTELSRQTGFDTEAQKPYGLFFHEIGARLAEPLPLVRGDLHLAPESFQIIGLLAAGLKDWEQGEFKEAAAFFEDFKNSPAPASEPWIGTMQSAVEPYLADFALFRKLPYPSSSMTEEELQKTIASLQAAEKSLQTRGSLKNFIAKRRDRAEGFLRKAREIPPAPNPSEWTEAEKAELTQIQQVVSSCSGLRETYLFSDAMVRLKALNLNTPKGKTLQQDLINGYDSANHFIEHLAARLNQRTYRGKVLRKTGVPLDAQITKASVESFTVDLGFGPNEVDLDQFSQAWLVEAATETLDPPSTENLPAWKEAFWFASVCGLPSQSTAITDKIAAVDPAFKEAYSQRLSKIQF